jgi:methylenetetrahydrofolate reductase (NADPH)
VKVTEHIQNSKETFFTFEIIPPLKGESVQQIYDALDPLMEFKPRFVDVTYHREEYVYKARENGLLERKSIRKRPGTVGICAALMNRYQIDAVPHLICGGFSKEETEDALIDLHFLGIRNILALRGDSIKSESHFIPEPNGHRYASDLLMQIRNMNNGIYLDEDLHYSTPTDFCIGVAGYPEKHYEAPNLNFDLEMLKKKVELGADYIVTQMFFDNQKFFEFTEKCRNAGINVPIIPGLKPISVQNHLTTLPRIFHIDIPEELTKEVLKCKNNKEVNEVGINWCIAQAKELIAAGVPCLHFYTMSKSSATYRVVSALA